MLDDDLVENLRAKLVNRYTPWELIDLLGVSTDDVFDKFFSECLEFDWSEELE